MIQSLPLAVLNYKPHPLVSRVQTALLKMQIVILLLWLPLIHFLRIQIWLYYRLKLLLIVQSKTSIVCNSIH